MREHASVLRGARRVPSLWTAYRPPALGQIPISVPPVEVRHELSGLQRWLLPVGLMGGGGLVFAVSRGLPESIQPVATLVSMGLLGAGVVTLLQRTGGAAAAAQPVPGVSPGAPFVPAGPAAFDAVVGDIVSPADQSTVDILLGVAGTYPVRVLVSNPSAEAVSFSLELEAVESPAFLPFGQRGDDVVSSKALQVSLGPGQSQPLDVAMPVASEAALADFIDVVLTARKRRSPGEAARDLDFGTFVIE